ncbi:MAG: hypothetical protein OHK003_30800 [Anaerolineales bacterium]
MSDRVIPDNTGGVACCNYASGNIPCYHTTRTNDAPSPDRYTFQNQAVHAYKDVVFNDNGRSQTSLGLFQPKVCLKRVKIGINNDGIGAHRDPVAYNNLFRSAKGTARHGKIIASPNQTARLPGAKDDRMIYPQRVGTGRGTQPQTVSKLY